MNMKTITVVPESEELAYLAKRVAAARNIVALAGAGMSQAAGIPVRISLSRIGRY